MPTPHPVVASLGNLPREVFESLDQALRTNHSVIDAALDSDDLEESDVLKEIADQCGFEWIETPTPDSEKFADLLRLFPAQPAIRNRVVPLDLQSSPDDGQLTHITLATYDPFNIFQRQAIQKVVDCPVTWKMTSRQALIKGLQDFYGVGAETFDELLASREEDDSGDLDLREEENIIDENDEEASVVKFVNHIVREGLSQRATDIHVEPLNKDLRIRYRIDGVLRNVPVPEQIKSLQDSVIARLKVMSRLDIAEKRLPQDGRIHLKHAGRAVDVRVATIPCVEGENVSLRLLGQEDFTLDRLNLLPEIRSDVDELLEKTNGIILVTGPTGCGKSTSLYCFLSALNTLDRRIVTIEDPVENKLEGLMQIAVKPDIDLTFANGLRSILRGDPNVIMVGEIRDLETAEISIRAALTGHLVLSTLHTNDAIGGISRLIDMGVEPFLVSTAVRAFMAQRLVRGLCAHCKEPSAYSPDYLHTSGLPEKYWNTIYSASPTGCSKCGGTGYLGRLAIYEVCLVTSALQDLIVNRASGVELAKQAVADGFLPMRDYGWVKVGSGETSIEEVLSVTDSGR